MATNATSFTCGIPSADIQALTTWSFLFVTLGLVIALSNFVMVLTFAFNKNLRRRSLIFLINLAVVDMLLGLFYSAYESLILFCVKLGVNVDGIVWIIVWVPGNHMVVLSILSLVFVALDRIYATFFPFRYRAARLRGYILVIVVTWLLPLPLSITENVTSGKLIIDCLYFFIVVMLYIVCLLIISASYIAIFLRVRTQTKRLQPNLQQGQLAAIQARQKREHGLAVTLFVITLLSVITWLPYIIVYSIHVALLRHNANKKIIPLQVYLFAVSMQFINSLINPITFVIREREFRNTFLRLICKWPRDRPTVNPIGHHGNNEREQQQGI